ncbi:MAG: hypothetical protein RLZ35_698 [Pseudomonadota bacterium]|jgi:hypothetical protein
MAWVLYDKSRELAIFRCDTSEAKISELAAYHMRGQLSICITLPEKSYQELHEYLHAHPDFGLTQANAVFMTPLGFHCSLTVDEGTGRNVLVRYLSMLQSFDPSIKEVAPDVKKALNYLGAKEIDEILYQNLDQKSFFSNLTTARRLYREGHRDALHRLAKICFEKGMIREGNSALNFIPDDDHLGHFWAANIYRKLADDVVLQQ